MKPEIILTRALGIDGGLWSTPWGIINIASYLKKYGYGVRLIDRPIPRFMSRVKEEIKGRDIAYVGISALTSQARDAEFLCSHFNKMKKKIILGGLHYTILPDEGLKIGDYVFKGEGERSLLDFLENGPTGRIYEAKPLLDLDEIPLPTEDMINKFYVKREFFTIMTSRGCPYNCTFCLDKKYTFNKVRYHSPAYVCDLIEMLGKSFGIRNFFIGDDIFISDKKRVMEICQEIKKRLLKIKFTVQTHSGIDDLELYQEMKDAGFVRICLGVESGSNEVLRAMNKQQTVEQARKTVEIIKKAGLEAHTNFMVGNILESEESLKATLELAEELGPPGFVSYAQPFPGTKFYEVCSQYGRLINHNPKTYWNDRITFVPHGISRFKLKYYRDKIAMALNVPVPLRRKLLYNIYEKAKPILCLK